MKKKSYAAPHIIVVELEGAATLLSTSGEPGEEVGGGSNAIMGKPTYPHWPSTNSLYDEDFDDEE